MNGAFIKFLAQAATSVSVTKVVTDIVKQNTIIQTPTQDLMVKVGGFVISSMMVEQATAHVDRIYSTMSNAFTKKDDEPPTPSTAP